MTFDIVKEKLEVLDVKLRDLHAIIISHEDFDHIEAWPFLKKKSPV